MEDWPWILGKNTAERHSPDGIRSCIRYSTRRSRRLENDGRRISFEQKRGWAIDAGQLYFERDGVQHACTRSETKRQLSSGIFPVHFHAHVFASSEIE